MAPSRIQVTCVCIWGQQAGRPYYSRTYDEQIMLAHYIHKLAPFDDTKLEAAGNVLAAGRL
jgi:hypothetical protein